MSDVTIPNIGLNRKLIIKREEVKRQIYELLDQEVIRTNMSPYGSPIILMQNKEKSWRMCIDFQDMNKITIKKKYPFIVFDDLTYHIKEGKFLTKLEY